MRDTHFKKDISKRLVRERKQEAGPNKSTQWTMVSCTLHATCQSNRENCTGRLPNSIDELCFFLLVGISEGVLYTIHIHIYMVNILLASRSYRLFCRRFYFVYLTGLKIQKYAVYLIETYIVEKAKWASDCIERWNNK